ncbi:MAG: family 10 glycosylhydrolase [Gemmatimonadaceae bacterium]
MMSYRALAAIIVVAALSACSGGSSSTAPAPHPAPVDTGPPAIQREMRGLWIATVANIDWPSRATLTSDQQKAELTDLLDRAASSGFNAVMFHVRPAGDAVYSSAIEPWGAMLTGTQGTDPGYDPLAFAVTEAHARGLEIHAWINPFRAGNSKDTLKLAATHLFNTRRALLRVYGSQLWMDPGEPAIHDHVMRVVSDIVQRYDIDGVHADDYFYPYQENDAAGKLIDFPDSASYARSGSTLARADWRRDNVDRFVERMYREVHALKPTIKVGLSPFGIWRPGNPASVAGLDAYATIYADSKKWLQQGWVDYLAPQLYWAIAAPQQSYPALLDWWIAQNTMNRHVWPGLAAYRVGDGTASAFNMNEIPNQIGLTRQRSAGTGHILYNTTSTLKKSNGALATSLATLYASRALVPASPWLDATPPPAPTMSLSGRTVTMTPGLGELPRWWVVRSRANGAWATRVLFGTLRSTTLDLTADRVLLTAVDQAGNMSSSTSWQAP